MRFRVRQERLKLQRTRAQQMRKHPPPATDPTHQSLEDLFFIFYGFILNLEYNFHFFIVCSRTACEFSLGAPGAYGPKTPLFGFLVVLNSYYVRMRACTGVWLAPWWSPPLALCQQTLAPASLQPWTVWCRKRELMDFSIFRFINSESRAVMAQMEDKIVPSVNLT